MSMNYGHLNDANDYQSLLQHISDAVIVVNEAHQITFWNPAAQRLFNYTATEALGQSISTLILLEADHKRFQHALHQQLNQPLTAEHCFEVQVRSKTGDSFLAELLILPDKSTSKGATLIFRDMITRLKTTDQQLTEQLGQAKSREQIAREIVDSIRGKRNLDDILTLAVKRLGEFTQVDRCVIWLYDEQTGKLLAPRHEYLANPSIPSVNSAPLAEKPYFAMSLSSTEPVHVPDVKGYCLEHQVDEELLTIRPVQSLLHIPLAHQGVLYGFLRFHAVQQPRYWDDETIALLSDTAANIAAAIEEIRRELQQQKQAQEAQLALQKSYDLIRMINEAQSYFITNEDPATLFENLLNKLLLHTHSPKGFIGEILSDATGKPKLTFRFLRGFSPRSSTKNHQQEQVQTPIHSLDSLIAQILQSGQPVIQNQSEPAEKNAVLPLSIHAFLGMPLYKGEQMVGIVGIANCSTSYTRQLVDDLQPYLLACANIIVGLRGELLRQQLTHELQLNERSLTLYAHKLEQSNKELDQFATIASHDLQAPLRKVYIFSEFLKSTAGDALPLESYDYMERIQKSIRKMQALINDLLVLSRVTRRGRPFRPIDLDMVVNEVLYDLEEQRREANGTIEIDAHLMIEADEIQMHQVFQNLIANALKFRKKDAPPYIRIEAKQVDPHYCEIRVIDQGIGFDIKYLDRIFSVFERLHGENEYAGTGMGLAIVHKIVERHSGSITAQSKPGQGTTFIIRLPIHHQPEAEMDVQATPVESPTIEMTL